METDIANIRGNLNKLRKIRHANDTVSYIIFFKKRGGFLYKPGLMSKFEGLV